MENLSTLRHKLCENCSKNFSSVFAHFSCSPLPPSLSPFIRSYSVRVWLCAIALCCHISLERLASLARCPMTFHFCVVHINCSLYHYLLWLDSFDMRWEEGRDYTVAQWLLCVDTESPKQIWSDAGNGNCTFRHHMKTLGAICERNGVTSRNGTAFYIWHSSEVGNTMRNKGFLGLSLRWKPLSAFFVSNHHRANDISLQTKLFAPWFILISWRGDFLFFAGRFVFRSARNNTQMSLRAVHKQKMIEKKSRRKYWTSYHNFSGNNEHEKKKKSRATRRRLKIKWKKATTTETEKKVEKKITLIIA